MIDKCWNCGNSAIKTLKNVPYCTECYNYARLKNKALEKQRQEVRIWSMYERALECLFGSKFPIIEHKREVEWVLKSALKHPGMLNSMPEMLTAIVCTAKGIALKTQVKIADFRVDFCIVGHKIIVEIDGERHDWEKDQFRDNYICRCLPKGWVVVRLKDKYVTSRPDKMIEEIEKQVSKKRGPFSFEKAKGGEGV